MWENISRFISSLTSVAYKITKGGKVRFKLALNLKEGDFVTSEKDYTKYDVYYIHSNPKLLKDGSLEIQYSSVAETDNDLIWKNYRKLVNED